MNPAKGNILIVEDDEAIATGVALNLRLEGYSSRIASDGVEAAELIAAASPDLILLDIAMPRKDGLELLQEIRDRGDRTPVIVLSARGGEHDKVAALRLGADDYVTKPFALAELIARVEAVLRRSGDNGQSAAKVFRFGRIEVRPETRKVIRDDDEVKLTHLEFELLHYFLQHPTRVLSRDLLLREVWGHKGAGSRRTVDNFVGQLRAKLESDPESPQFLVTVRGSGYRFSPEDEGDS